MSNPERGAGAPDQENKPYVLLRRNAITVMSDGSVIEGKENNEKINNESWDAYLATLPAEEAEYLREHKQDLDKRLAEFRKKYPVGSQIDMGSYLEKTFGSLEEVGKLKELYDKRAALRREMQELARQKQQGKDVETAMEQHFLVRLENERKIEQLLETQKIYGGSLSIESDALKILQTHPDGKILYSFDGEDLRPNDSFKIEFLTKHGNDVLHYEAVCHEFGMGIYYSVNSARDYVRHFEQEEKESIAEKADMEALKKLEK